MEIPNWLKGAADLIARDNFTVTRITPLDSAGNSIIDDQLTFDPHELGVSPPPDITEPPIIIDIG